MRILLVEDNASLNQLVAAYLSQHFRVDSALTYDEALYYIDQFGYDVVLLDRNLNDEDVGMQLIEKIKRKSPTTGVIIISAYDTTVDKITGLNLGADDYLDKPFDNDELLARIIALSRRHQALPSVEIQGLQCDMQNKTLSFEGAEVKLSKKESELFFYLLQKQGRIVSKEELLNALYLNPENISSNTIDVTLRNVRRKLPVDIIKTIKTRGYIID